MTPAEKTLNDILSAAYRAEVLHMGSPDDALNAFKRSATDPAIVLAARAELDRASSFHKQRCFVSSVNRKFLRKALDSLMANPSSDASQKLADIPIILNAQPREKDHMTSKLKALAGLAKSTVAKVEADAEAAVNRLQAAQAKASAGVGKIHSVAGEIEQSAVQLEDFAAQITNGGPPLGDS